MADKVYSPWDGGIPLDHLAPREAAVIQDRELFGVTIPAGYKTDGASVPAGRARYTDLLPAALVHDFRYDPAPSADGVKRRTLTRKQADAEFYKHLLICGVPRWRAWIAHRAVRAGGWAPWNRGTKKGTENV